MENNISNNPRVLRDTDRSNPASISQRTYRSARRKQISPTLFSPPSSQLEMPKTKEAAPDVVRLSTSNVPDLFQFPLLVIISLTLSSALYSVASVFTAGDLSGVSRSLDDWWEVAGLIGWKTAELAVGWWGEYDSTDLASLTLLSHAPHFYLLSTFYGIRPTTVISCLLVDILTAYLPLSLLRDHSATHLRKAPKGAVANPLIINDLSVRLYLSILAAVIYSVVIFGSFATFLPVYLVIHFDGIRDISATHSAALPVLILLLLPIGYAAREFLFTASIGAKPDANDVKSASFNPETATLRETMEHNLWGCSKRTRTLIKRTATLVLITGLHTWLQTYVAIEGVEGYGAAGWSGVWALAATITGLAFWWVGNVDGVTKEKETKPRASLRTANVL